MLPNFIFIFLIIWNVLITYFLFRSIGHYNRLVKYSGKRTLKEVLEELIKNSGKNSQDIEKISALCKEMEKEGNFHFKKIGIVRFNPFSDTGGNQSFALVILNSHDDGFVISSLHSRIQTRWYAKTIKSGKALEHELSEEEKKALSEAIKSTK